MKVLAASAILAGCLALTCAQPETIDLRGWSDFGANSQYGAWQYGFPAGTTLSSLMSGTVGVEAFFRTLMHDKARGNVEDFWTYLSYAHAECALNEEPDAISVAYMLYVCQPTIGAHAFCPDPCGSDPCPAAASACVATNQGIFEDDFQCTCRPGYTWDATLRDCVATVASSSTVAPSMTTVALPVLPIITRPTVAQFTPAPPSSRPTVAQLTPALPSSRPTVAQLTPALPSSRPTVAQLTPALPSSPLTPSAVPRLMQRLSWDNLSQIYSKWRHGFPPGTSLTSLLPGVDDPDDYFNNLYTREANNDIFWERMMAASKRGELVTDAQLLSLAFIFFVCGVRLRALADCPDPCGTIPCLKQQCTVSGVGLYSDEYECICEAHYHWDLKKSKCVFCGPGERWDDTLDQCMRGGAMGTTMPGPTDTWSNWSAWTDCSTECGAGTRKRRRTCISGNCSGSALQDASCEGTGYWLCDNRLLYAIPATLAFLALITGALVFLLKHNKVQEAGYTRLPSSREQRPRPTRSQTMPLPRRRPPPKPTAHPPTRQWNPNVQRQGQSQGQRSKPDLNRPPQNRPPQNRPPQNLPPQNRPPQNWPPQNRPPQNLPPQNRPPQNWAPQNRPPQNWPPQNRSGDMSRTGNTSRQFGPGSNPPYQGPPLMRRTT